MSTDTRPEAGLSPERLTFFTDAIFAIAMTLLAVELARPESADLASGQALWQFLVGQRSSYLAFVLAFVLLWSVWRRHHRLMDRVRRLSRTFAFWHAPFLLLVAFLPFPTAVTGAAITNPVAQSLFAGVMAAMVGCEAVIREVSVSAGLGTDEPAAARRNANASWSVGLWFLLSAGLAWLVPYAFLLWFLAPVVAAAGAPLLTGLRGHRRTRPAGPDAIS